MRRRREPIGVILAGGSGRRIGGSKAVVAARGQAADRLSAARRCATALSDVAVVAKADTAAAEPARGDGLDRARRARATRWSGSCRRWRWPRGAPVLVCAADLPFVTAELIDRLATRRSRPRAGRRGRARAATSSRCSGCYRAERRWSRCAGRLAPTTRPLRECVAAIGRGHARGRRPRRCCSTSTRPRICCSAAAMLDRRRPAEPATG